MRCSNYIQVFFLLTIWMSQSISAQARGLQRYFPAEDTEISLVTVGQGRAEYTVAGHLALRIKSPASDIMANWGVFNLSDPNFINDYIHGRMDYMAIAERTSSILKLYEAERRTVWIDPLQLTVAQKQSIINQVFHWIKPENRTYRYHFWKKNCSSIIIDVLAEALGQGFADRLAVDSKKTIRQISEPMFSKYHLLAFIADIGFNSTIDVPVSLRNTLYAPIYVRNTLKTLPSFNDMGEEEPGTHLIPAKNAPYFQGQTVAAPFIRYENIITVVFGLLLLLVALSVKTNMKLARAAAAFALFTVGFSFAAMSITIWYAWINTQHDIIHHNTNLLFLFPFDLWLVVPAWKLLRGQPIHWETPIWRWTKTLFALHGAGMLILWTLAITGLTTQSVWAVSVYLLPSLLMTWVMLWLVKH